MIRKISFFFLISCLYLLVGTQTPQPIKQFLRKPYMEGASLSLIVKEVSSGETVSAYGTIRQLIPASVTKTVTTATALEILDEDYRFPTALEYDGFIENGLLKGNLYVKGSGDPSLGSTHFAPNHKRFLQGWISASKKVGIHKIQGAVIADESIFDTEGTPLRWVGEDMGSYHGAGSYGLHVFDNLYKLGLQIGAPGTRPKLKGTKSELSGIHFRNYLTAQQVSSNSSFIVGAPFATDRYLYGIVPVNREWYPLKGNIPDPALFLADYLTRQLEHERITVGESSSCFRISREADRWQPGKRTEIVTIYSPTLREIVEVTSHVSHNLFADALTKTIGLRYMPRKGEVLSSFNRDIQALREYWQGKGLDLSRVWMYDGSGLVATNRLSTAFIAGLLIYVKTCSQQHTTLYESLPVTGVEGSVRNFLKGSSLQGKAHLKSGNMSRVKGYAGYINKGDKQHAIALFVNSYSCDGHPMTVAIEKLLLQLFN